MATVNTTLDFRRVDSLLERRGTDGSCLVEALSLLEKERDDTNLHVMARLSRAYWHSGDLCTTDSLHRAQMWGKGVETGKIAVGIRSDHNTILELMPHHWYATNLGSHAKMVSMGVAATYLKPLYHNACEAVKLNKDYDGGGPLRVLARYLMESPPWPVGHQDKKKGLQLTEEAYACDPDKIVNCLETGDILAFSQKDPKKKERGMRILLDALILSVPIENPNEFLKYRGSILRVLDKNNVPLPTRLLNPPSIKTSVAPDAIMRSSSPEERVDESKPRSSMDRPRQSHIDKDHGVVLYPASEMMLAVGFHLNRDYFDIF